MKILRLFLTVFSLAASVVTPPPAPAVGPAAVFRPGEDFLAGFHAACATLAGGEFGECFVAQMSAAGASPAAVDFARRTGNRGYLRELRETGAVDVAFVEYPFRANENQGCLLVNGDPAMFDVDDPAHIASKDLEANSVYAFLRKNRPKVAIFPGDRSGASGPLAQSRRGGGQRFMVLYRLRDGCHACVSVGYARVAFDFDALGKYLGTEILQVRSQLGAATRGAPPQ